MNRLHSGSVKRLSLTYFLDLIIFGKKLVNERMEYVSLIGLKMYLLGYLKEMLNKTLEIVWK